MKSNDILYFFINGGSELLIIKIIIKLTNFEISKNF